MNGKQLADQLKANAAMTVIDRFLDAEGSFYAPPDQPDHAPMRRERLVQALAAEIGGWMLPQPEPTGWYCEPVIEVGHPVGSPAWVTDAPPDHRVPADVQPVILGSDVPGFEEAAVAASVQRKREGLWRVHRMATEPEQVRTIPTYAVIHVASPAQDPGAIQ